MKRRLLFFALTGALFGVAVTGIVLGAPALQTEGPAVPHTVEGREACLECHTVGEGSLAMPEDHADRAEGSCLVCHAAPEPAEEGEPTPEAEPTTAEPAPTEETAAAPTPVPISTEDFRGPEFCSQCHEPHIGEWQDSTHANAFQDPIFQESWEENRQPGYCLGCHATGYDPNTGQPMFEGVTCESCHGTYREGHPQSDMMPVDAGAERCGVCHVTTYQEWQLSDHAERGVNCASCHAVHSQGLLFATATALCASCHGDRADDFAHAAHAEHAVTCADCHMYRPPDASPNEGLLPTGHFFSVESQACTQCHTRDSIHSPGGMTGAETGDTSELTERISTLEGQVDEMEAAGDRNLVWGLVGGAVGGGLLGVIFALLIRGRIAGGNERGSQTDA